MLFLPRAVSGCREQLPCAPPSGATLAGGGVNEIEAATPTASFPNATDGIRIGRGSRSGAAKECCYGRGFRWGIRIQASLWRGDRGGT